MLQIVFAVPVKIVFRSAKMSYKKATHVLPQDLVLKVPDYIDGEFLYIPRTAENKKRWEDTTIF